MRNFATTRDAKEFLVGRIVAEAQREGLSLSEVERKMFYFSETAWTLPDITETNDAFDRDYDEPAFEEKIATLIRNLCAYSRKTNPEDFHLWNEAVRRLRSEDHYLLVMIAAADKSPARKHLSLLELAGIGLVLACIVLLVGYLYLRR